MALHSPIIAPKNRDYHWKLEWIRGEDGTTKIAFASGSDVLYFKVWTTNNTPVLELNSNSATSNGSIITIDTAGDGTTTDTAATVKIAAEDTASLTVAGKYRYELLMHDDSADTTTQIVHGDFEIDGTAGGSIG